MTWLQKFSYLSFLESMTARVAVTCGEQNVDMMKLELSQYDLSYKYILIP